MKYRIKSIEYDDETKFYPQWRFLGYWFYYYTGYTEIKLSYNTLKKAKKFIASRSGSNKFKRVKIYQLND